MAAQTNLNETMQNKSQFIRFEDRASDHPFVEKVWRCHSERADSFLSVAANNFEIAITRLGGKSFVTLRGPETKQLRWIVPQGESGSASASRWALSCPYFRLAAYETIRM
jgi:hypothetical protein